MKTPLVPFQFTPITQNAAIAGSFWMFIPLHGPKGIVSSPPIHGYSPQRQKVDPLHYPSLVGFLSKASNTSPMTVLIIPYFAIWVMIFSQASHL